MVDEIYLFTLFFFLLYIFLLSLKDSIKKAYMKGKGKQDATTRPPLHPNNQSKKAESSKIYICLLLTDMILTTIIMVIL
jgi:hypothetical protein